MRTLVATLVTASILAAFGAAAGGGATVHGAGQNAVTQARGGFEWTIGE